MKRAEAEKLGAQDTARITLAFWRAIKTQGRGTISHLEDVFGLCAGALRKRKKRQSFNVRQMCEILAYIGYPVSVCIAEAFDQPTSAGDRFRAQGAVLLARGAGGDMPALGSPERPDVLTAADFERLDLARFDDPAGAAKMAREVAFRAAAEGRRGDAVAAIARMGSALRLAEQWHDAHAAVCWALNHAPEGSIRADTWLRAGFVVSDYGEYEAAAELARMSLLESVELADDAGAARALVSRGMNFRRAGQPLRAIRCLRAALCKMPAEIPRTMFSAHLSTGLAYVDVGDLRSAEGHSTKAASLDVPAPGLVHLGWLRARIAFGRGDHDQAARLYRDVAASVAGAPADAALVGVELARVYLQADRPAEVVEVSRGLASLAMPWRANRVVSSAIRDLWCSAGAGELTPAVLARITKRIRRARELIQRRRSATTTAVVGLGFGDDDRAGDELAP